jgi:hypothetical protein
LAIARVFPRIRSDAISLADAASAQHDGLGFKNDEATGLTPVCKCACNAPTVHQQLRHRAFHINVYAQRHTAILQGANHFQACAITDVHEPFVGVAAKRTLHNVAVGSAVKQCAPLLKFAHAVGGFLRVELGHTPVIQKLAAAHGVAKVRLPAIRGVYIGHCRRNAAFGHHGVRFTKQRFADDSDRRALPQSFKRCAQPCAARTDDQDIVFMRFVLFVCHKGEKERKPATARLP